MFQNGTTCKASLQTHIYVLAYSLWRAIVTLCTRILRKYFSNLKKEKTPILTLPQQILLLKLFLSKFLKTIKKLLKTLHVMTEEKKSTPINYLSSFDLEAIYKVSYRRFIEIEEPIPPFKHINKAQLIHLETLPKTSFFGKEQYPTLESKAAIIFYKINKGHIFPNGNKRLSVYITLVFLMINNKFLNVSQDEMTSKALEIATSSAENFEEVKNNLELWIKNNMKESEV